MTKRDAKIEALRLATAMLNNPPTDFSSTSFTEDEEAKILDELSKIADSLKDRAVKLGGDFNEYLGLVETPIV